MDRRIDRQTYIIHTHTDRQADGTKILHRLWETLFLPQSSLIDLKVYNVIPDQT